MTFRISDPEAEKLVRDLAKEAGENLTVAVTVAVRERLGRIRKKRANVAEALLRIGAAAPKPMDLRPMGELLGYRDKLED